MFRFGSILKDFVAYLFRFACYRFHQMSLWINWKFYFLEGIIKVLEISFEIILKVLEIILKVLKILWIQVQVKR